MTPAEDVALWCALNRMIAEYWADLDEKGGQAAHQFYLLRALRHRQQQVRGTGQDPGFLCQTPPWDSHDAPSHLQCSGGW